MTGVRSNIRNTSCIIQPIKERNSDQQMSNEELKRRQCCWELQKDFVERIPFHKQIRFSWCNINVYKDDSNPGFSSTDREKTLPQEKQILTNVSGNANPGELLVIIGPSGAGKTTLLNCMTFRNLKNFRVSGLICINDLPVRQIQLASQSAYVQQDDIFIEYLTVREHLIFQSLVKMEAHFSYDERLDRVERVMKELSLKKCEHCAIGSPGIKKSISGGERKRLALASEFLTNPSLLFCDEPTTGLDSFMALNIVQMLKGLAKSGRTVIATLHQPSSELFQLFDKIFLIADGRTAFLGTTAEASMFFSELNLPCSKNFNPADHYIQLLSIIPGRKRECERIVNGVCYAFAESVSGVKINKAAQEMEQSVDTQSHQWIYNHKIMIPYKVGWFSQMKALLWRSWISILRKPEVTKSKLIIVIMEAFFFAIIYYGQILNQYGIKNLDGVFAFYVTNVTYQNVYGTINNSLVNAEKQTPNGSFCGFWTEGDIEPRFSVKEVHRVVEVTDALYYDAIAKLDVLDGVCTKLFYMQYAREIVEISQTPKTFCSEIPLFTKENKDGMYRTDTYYLSKIICDIPISCILAMLYPAIGYYFIGFNSEFSRYLTTLLIMVLVSQAALGAGYIISVILPRLEHADAGINILLFPLLIFGGFFLNIGSVPTYLQWLSDLSWFKYGYEMFMINQWYGISHIQCNANFSASSDCIADGEGVLSTASISPGGFWIAVGCSIFLIISFRVIAFLCLLLRTYRNE